MLTSSLSALDPKPSLAVQFFALRYSLFDHLVGEREQRGWHGTDYDIAGLAHCGDDEFTPIMLSPARWMRFGGKSCWFAELIVANPLYPQRIISLSLSLGLTTVRIVNVAGGRAS